MNQIIKWFKITRKARIIRL